MTKDEKWEKVKTKLQNESLEAEYQKEIEELEREKNVSVSAYDQIF